MPVGLATVRRDHPLTDKPSQCVALGTGLGLKLAKRAAERAPRLLNLVTWGDENGPQGVPALGSPKGPVCQL